MKRTKQVQQMIDIMNKRLRDNHIKDENETCVSTLMWLLLETGTYKGFNYFTKDGILSGGINTDFIQII